MAKRFMAVILVALLVATVFSVGVSASSARLLDIDRTTRGNWVGNYGSEGWLIATDDESLQSLPEYVVAVEFLNEFLDGPASFWTWWDEEEHGEIDEDWRVESALLRSPDSSYRIASCHFGTEFNVIIDIGDETRKVSLYLTDFDEGPREAEITVFDADDNELMPMIEVYNYEEGIYLQFVMSGRVRFHFYNLAAHNAVISGVFFDPDPDAPEPVEAVPLEIEPREYGVGGGYSPEAEAAIAAVAVDDVAPPTADPVSLIILGSLVSAVGVAVAKKRK